MKQATQHELAGIELLRFLSAFSILIWHYPHFFFTGQIDGPVAEKMWPSLPVYSVLYPVYRHGFLAVDVFWVISGFIFYWRYAQPVYDRWVSGIKFATRRFSRLYPLHFATLLFVALLQYIYLKTHGSYFIYSDNSASTFVAQLFFAANWFNGQTFSFNGPLWSVSAEVLVYCFFFWSVRLVGRSLVVIVGAMGLSWLLLHYCPFLVFNTSVFECCIFFFAGGFAHWLHKKDLRLLVPACAIVLTVIVLAHQPGFFSVTVVSSICIVVAFARLSETKWKTILGHAAFFGKATYSSYLIHFPVQLAIVMVLDALGYSRSVFFNSFAFFGYLSLVIVVSLIVYHLFELPAQNWIRAQVGRTQSPSRVNTAIATRS
jgi:peptidoglycan/LPS O-acetylase OafA/YrhL